MCVGFDSGFFFRAKMQHIFTKWLCHEERNTRNKINKKKRDTRIAIAIAYMQKQMHKNDERNKIKVCKYKGFCLCVFFSIIIYPNTCQEFVFLCNGASSSSGSSRGALGAKNKTNKLLVPTPCSRLPFGKRERHR